MLTFRHACRSWIACPSKWRSCLSTNAKDAEDLNRINAWQIHNYGGIEELIETKRRAPIIRRPNDVIVAVHAASVNPLDIAMLGSYGSGVLNLLRQVESCTFRTDVDLPLTLGRDFSGLVIAKGLEVDDVNVGDEVWGFVPPHLQGSHGEQVMVPKSCLCKKPERISLTEAGSMVYTGMTAWSALKVTADFGLVSPIGQRVLVLGAAGGVGLSAVQLLQAWGATVVCSAATDAMPMLYSLGVPLVIDYTKDNVVTRLMAEPKFDVILDCAGLGMDQGSIYYPLLKQYSLAKFITLKSPFLKNIDQLGAPLGMIQNIRQLLNENIDSNMIRKSSTVRWAFFMPIYQGLQELTSLTEQGKLNPNIEQEFPFTQVPEAYRRVAAGHLRGKVVIDMVK